MQHDRNLKNNYEMDDTVLMPMSCQANSYPSKKVERTSLVKEIKYLSCEACRCSDSFWRWWRQGNNELKMFHAYPLWSFFQSPGHFVCTGFFEQVFTLVLLPLQKSLPGFCTKRKVNSEVSRTHLPLYFYVDSSFLTLLTFPLSIIFFLSFRNK